MTVSDHFETEVWPAGLRRNYGSLETAEQTELGRANSLVALARPAHATLQEAVRHSITGLEKHLITMYTFIYVYVFIVMKLFLFS